MNPKSVLHQLKNNTNLYLSRCSTDLWSILGHSVDASESTNNLLVFLSDKIYKAFIESFSIDFFNFQQLIDVFAFSYITANDISLK